MLNSLYYQITCKTRKFLIVLSIQKKVSRNKTANYGEKLYFLSSYLKMPRCKVYK